MALDVLERIESGGAFANLVLPQMLARSGLSERDRGFVTDLVYGTTRWRRACDFLVDRFLFREVVGRARSALRLGAYQLVFAGVPAHAAVAETVAASPKAARGLVNAVLRRVAADLRATGGVAWPDEATRLSVPDWVLQRLVADLGDDRAVAALEAMNRPAEVVTRPDGYVQDAASQQVAAAVGAAAGEVVVDTCAAPGGKATALAGTGARVVAGDVREARARLVRTNAARLDLAERLVVVVADGTRPPLRPGMADRVLVDAPCSGLGTLGRRPDLRWRVDRGAPARLAELQRALVDAAADVVQPGGLVVYSVCTLTAEESTGVDDWLAEHRPDLVALDDLPAGGWERWGRGAILLPQTAGTDGMCLFRYRRSP
ncbi:MAG TPA: transcription antitermination factor NusB [Acidimicrobiales bacterium]